MVQNPQADHFGEECGVMGVFCPYGDNVASQIYYGLFALQHRGQESCGIATSEGELVHHYKGMGLLGEVFSPTILENLPGSRGIGHIRYSTSGTSVSVNAQPLVIQYSKGTLAIAHNGNLTNSRELRRELESRGAIFQTTIDSEVIAYRIASERVNTHSLEDAVIKSLPAIRGAYSLLVMSPRKLIAARDPHGFRPLCIGERDGNYVFASETCALSAVGANFVRDVRPGEVVMVDESGIRTVHQFPASCHVCIFEYIYFARPDSIIDGVSVYESRYRAGQLLSQNLPVEADMVVGVPDSGTIAALGYAQKSGIPYGVAFEKNRYVGRTFIAPKQSTRELAVRLKLSVIKSNVEGKRIIMIDDSIVRGTTCANIVRMLKSAGAKEVHVRISSPPFRWPCYFGTDVSNREQLTANTHSLEELREMIDADTLSYLNIDQLKDLVGHRDYCHACFSGDYPSPPPDEDIRAGTL